MPAARWECRRGSQAAWEAYRRAPIHDAFRKDFDARQVRFENHTSPYTVKTVGTRPAQGWALFIAMHGGGGAPKEVNDSQWKQMQIYYRDRGWTVELAFPCVTF